jgi:hypothetical protein
MEPFEQRGQPFVSVRASVFASNLALRQSGGKRRTFGGWLHTLAYGLWLGGLIGIGALVAPNVAKLLQHSGIADNEQLKDLILVNVIGNSLKLFNYVCYACAGCMILGDLLQTVSAEPEYRQFTGGRTFLTLILLGSALYLGFILFPEMDRARLSAHMIHFQVLHKRYELVSELQLIPLLIIPALTAQRDRVLNARF